MVPIAVCIAEAANTYHVEQARISAIVAEGLKARARPQSRLGLMGIPAQWVPILQLMGISPDQLVDNPCTNVFAGTWILAYTERASSGQAEAAARRKSRHVTISRAVARRRERWLPVVHAVAKATGVPAALIDAVITVESRYQAGAISPAHAIGMMQLLPSTAAMLGGDPWDAGQNILMGARYLGQLARKFNGNIELTLAAYNAGPAAVSRNGYRVPPFRETMNYVSSVMALYYKELAKENEQAA